jgi:hypothetical protein
MVVQILVSYDNYGNLFLLTTTGEKILHRILKTDTIPINDRGAELYHQQRPWLRII